MEKNPELELREALPDEKLYLYTQSQQIKMQTGFIGYLRGDFDKSGTGFFTTWFDFNEELKTDVFKTELDTVINSLRFDEKYEGILKGRKEMLDFCGQHKESAVIGKYDTQYGFRINTKNYSYLIRCNPVMGDYNFFVYTYKKEWFDRHFANSQNGIRFINSSYKPLFRIPDGGSILLEFPNGQREMRICRYIDEYHTEVGSNLFHICEFAERMEIGSVKYSPVMPTLPDRCYSVLPSSGKLILIKFGEHGYLPCSVTEEYKGNERELADKYNQSIGGVTKAQESAMLHGSMFGWNTPGADSGRYDENGNPVKEKNKNRESR